MDATYKVFLNLDLGWLDRVADRDKVPALTSFIARFRGSKVEFAISVYQLYCRLDANAPAVIAAGGKSSYLAQKFKKETKRISEACHVGKVALKYRSELEETGIGLFDEENFTKLLKLERALKTHKSTRLVFRNFHRMSSDEFSRYASGKPFAYNHERSPIGRYYDGITRQK